MQCEICGKGGASARIQLDGIEMLVCGGCGHFGKPVVQQAQAQQKSFAARKILFGAQEKFEQLVLVDDFGKRIKAAREKKQLAFDGLSRMVGEKASVLRNIETGHLQPARSTAERLEKALGIKIIEQAQ